METTTYTTFKTLAVTAVLLLAGALASSLVTSAEQAASDAQTFVGTMPATGATEGNVVDMSY